MMSGIKGSRSLLLLGTFLMSSCGMTRSPSGNLTADSAVVMRDRTFTAHSDFNGSELAIVCLDGKTRAVFAAEPKGR